MSGLIANYLPGSSKFPRSWDSSEPEDRNHGDSGFPRGKGLSLSTQETPIGSHSSTQGRHSALDQDRPRCSTTSYRTAAGHSGNFVILVSAKTSSFSSLIGSTIVPKLHEHIASHPFDFHHLDCQHSVSSKPYALYSLLDHQPYRFYPVRDFYYIIKLCSIDAKAKGYGMVRSSTA